MSQMSDEELKSVKISYILSHLVRDLYSSNGGTPIEVDYADKKIMVNLYSNSDPTSERESSSYHLSDDYVAMTEDQTVDLSVISRNNYSYYTLEIMIGSGEQLDYEAVRYRIRVVQNNEFYVNNSYTVYGDADKTVRIAEERIEEIKLDGVENVDIPSTSVYYYIPEESYSADKEYVFVPRSSVSSNSGNVIRSALYKMDDVLSYYRGEVKTLETEKALSEVKGTFAKPEESAKVTSADLYCMVYFLASGDGSESVIAYEGLQFIVAPSEDRHELPEGAIYSYKDGGMEKISRDNPNLYEAELSANRWIRLSVEKNAMALSHYSTTGEVSYRIEDGHTDKEDYYYVLDSSLKDKVSKVVAGYYSTEASAQRGEDITAQIFADENAAAPYGYKISFSDENNSRYRYFTLIYTVYRYEVYLSSISSASVTTYSDDPFVNSQDPWFRVNGCTETYRTYYVENDRDRTLDTLYGYKYQTVFVNDDVDLSQIKPRFWTNSSSGYEVKVVNTKTQEVLKSGETVQDFSNGPVQYTVYVGDSHQRNYYVQFVKKVSGAELFVNYPSDLMEEGKTKRTIFLTEYFENRHDILIANIGDTDLTGLKVELSDDAQHVALDDYWTVNGEAHSTLKGFDNSTYYARNDGELQNFAKVRLVPDGEGEITGTLTISADNQDPVKIELTGYASNPTIVTATLSNAVRYVPFSNVVATNNMLDNNVVTFSIEDGELPEGIELRPHSGEIYGVPKETGDYTFTVKADYSRVEFVPSYTELKLTVLDNTNENVYSATDEGYEIQEHIGQDMGGYDYYLAEPSDQLFVSNGVMDEFDHKVFLNGEELEEGVDYTAESGSTRITIKSQTFSSKAKRDGSVNTIAAEFRKKDSVGTVSAGKGTETTQEMKETSQNFRMGSASGGSTSGSGSSGSTSGSTSGSGSSGGSSTTSSSAPAVVPDSNWTQDETGWRHQLDDGSWATSSWQKLTYNGVTNWYYFGADGYMMTGWFTDADGQRYYLNPATDGTQGAMAVGWLFIDGEWYYFNTADEGTEGALTNSGWHYLEYNGVKDWYYFDSSQIMASGWITADGRRYYLNPVSDGFKGRVLTGWQQIDGRWYYFNEQSDGTKGAMMTDTTIGEYYVGRDGVWVQ